MYYLFDEQNKKKVNLYTFYGALLSRRKTRQTGCLYQIIVTRKVTSITSNNVLLIVLWFTFATKAYTQTFGAGPGIIAIRWWRRWTLAAYSTWNPQFITSESLRYIWHAPHCLASLGQSPFVARHSHYSHNGIQSRLLMWFRICALATPLLMSTGAPVNLLTALGTVPHEFTMTTLFETDIGSI